MLNFLEAKWAPAVLTCLVLSDPIAQTARADVIDFDTLPHAYLFLGGNQNIGTYYSGVDFESNVTGLDLAGSTAFPPPDSGSIVAWDPVDLFVTISFASPQSMVGVWYTSLDPLKLDAFDGTDGMGALLGSVVGAANTDGTTGTSDFLSFSGAGIDSLTLTSTPGNYVFDDLTLSPGTPTPVPEPSSLSLLATLILALACAGVRFQTIERRGKSR